MSARGHEVTRAFAAAGLPLCRALSEMLDEHFSHQTERRGCGFTQATRFLGALISRPRDPVHVTDLSVFADWPQQATEALGERLVNLGWSRGWRSLDQAPPNVTDALGPSPLIERLRALQPRVHGVFDRVQLVESRLLVGLLRDLLSGRGAQAPEIPGMPEKPKVGSCSQAEEFFLEIAHERIRRGGFVNTIVDRTGEPVMVEKMNLGESHSAMVVAPVSMFGVWLPPGSLCALKYDEPPAPLRQSRHGHMIALSGIAQARFLRLTTLAVPPEARRRTFNRQVEAQIRADMFSPLVTTIDQVREFARNELAVLT